MSNWAPIQRHLGITADGVPGAMTAAAVAKALGIIVTGTPRTIGKAGIALIQAFEGCEELQPDGRFKAYPDPGSGDEPWTIGWGSTGPDVRPGVSWTQAECDARFERDIQKYADAVSRAIGDTLTSQNMFDALVSFHYNTGAIGKATLTKLHNARDYAGAQREFAKWNKAAGHVMNGLIRRRKAEADLYGRP